MSKAIAYTILLGFFLSCNQKKEKISKELPASKNDTFVFFTQEDNIKILSDFLVDTIKYFDKKLDYRKTIICPQIIGKEFTSINKILTNEIKRKAALSYLDTLANVEIEKVNEMSGMIGSNILLKMYKNKKLISYGFLSEYDDPKAMRPFRKYFAINYDTSRKKFIYFEDYFTVKTPTDSLVLKSIIYGHIANPETKWYPIDNNIVFSIDNENIHFYFDMFGVLGNPMGLVKSVKLKYLDKFINDNYK
ncbi:MAG: hypothetical protein KA319_02345 [Ferruginibacter sp.]|nr:hypothetical protein [Ferruginibacter sp.]